MESISFFYEEMLDAEKSEGIAEKSVVNVVKKERNEELLKENVELQEEC